jgi:23S rRNA pseudouridine1911/1915/1917 synthase
MAALMATKLSFRVSAGEAGTRLDKFLAARSGLSRLLCRRAIEEGAVWQGRRRLRRLSMPVEAGQLIELNRETAPEQPLPVLRILYEDAALVAVDKPAGLPSQATLSSDRRDALAIASQQIGRELRTVHRLDAGTSGVLLLVKNHAAASALAAQFREGTARKIYRAICCGRLPHDAGQIDLPIQADRRPGSQRVSVGGAPAQTDYRLLAARGPLLLVDLRPLTGRTHQLRVHLSHLGAPVFGDVRYRGPRTIALPDGGFARADRPLLHAAELRVTHPVSGKALVLRADDPADFTTVAELFA